MPLLIITCNPGSDDLALRELRLASHQARLAADLGGGVLLVETQEAFGDVAGKWRAQPPIFARHICPADQSIELTGDMDDVARLRSAVASLVSDAAADRTFSVQTRLLVETSDGRPAYKPFDINSALAEHIHDLTGAPLDVRAPQQVLSIVIARVEGTITGFAGWSGAADNLSDWAGGVRRFARDDQQISRSEFKLLEAIELFAIDLSAMTTALDLGAAPGGWTGILRMRGLYVTAVDPAALDSRVLADRGVRDHRMTTEQYLRTDPDSFDLIVNDMRMDGRDSARLMVDCARLLRRPGAALMTLKLPEHDRQSVLDHTFNILRKAYTVAGARQLFHNRSEITIYLIPASPV